MRYLCGTLLIAAVVAGQTPAAGGPEGTEELVLVVLQGQGAVHNIVTGEVIEPVVEVRDVQARPVAGAEVTFELTGDGPGGTFPGRKTVLTVKTNAAGQAGGIGFVPNDVEGSFGFVVTAKLRNRVGRTMIRQSNSRLLSVERAPAKKPRSAAWKALLVIGSVAASGGLYLLTHSGGSESVKPPDTLNGTISITPGPVTVSPPK